MKKTVNKIKAASLVLAMCIASLTGCGKEEKREKEFYRPDMKTEEATVTDATVTDAKTEESTEEEVIVNDSNTLVVSLDGIAINITPFFRGESIYDFEAFDMVNVCLLESDREDQYITMGKTGETRNYNGTDYTYYGIADMTTSQNDDGTYNYNFDLRDDIYFSDGERLTADDAIFSLYVILDPSYDGYYSYLKGRKIKGLDEYINGKSVNEESGNEEPVASIEGIKKTGDFSFCITTTVNYSNFNFVVAPLHYYGDLSKYDYDNNSFGFDKGDLSKIPEKDSMPLGAGPYEFIKDDNGTFYFKANEYYYKGVPKCEKLIMIGEREGFYLDKIYDGITDIAKTNYSLEEKNSIEAANSNGEITGDKVTTFTEDNMGYGYLSMSANRVKVGEDRASVESKNLRKAFMTLFSVYRDESVDAYYGDTAHVINYPVPDSSWAAPQKGDVGYEIAYSRDVNNNVLYDENTPQEERVAAAKTASLGYLEAAGYVVENGKVVSAPEGASMEYEVWIYAGGSIYHPLYNAIINAQNDLAEMGISLVIVDGDVTGEDLWTAINEERVDMWCGGWYTLSSPNMRNEYYSGINPEDPEAEIIKNHMCIADAELDKLIIESEKSSDRDYLKTVYKKSYDIVLDWGVELPAYQRMNALVISTERVNLDTLPDVTPYYEWYREIEKVEKK